MDKKKSLQNYLKNNSKLKTAIGDLDIEKTSLGEGGNGIVYKATLKNTEKNFDVAVKFLITDEKNTHSDKKVRFLAEYINIRFLEDLRNIAKPLHYETLSFTKEMECYEDNLRKEEISEILEYPYIIMDCCEGNLKQKKASIDIRKLLAFLLTTVKYIHDNGIIHRDIKPENILIKSGKCFLADFGIAAYDSFPVDPQTGKRERLNNAMYSAPEQQNNNVTPTKTMDIYAIGQVLQWFATGSPHSGTNRQKINSDSENAFYEIIDSIVEKCLCFEPKSRFQSIQEIEEFIKDEEFIEKKKGEKNAMVFLSHCKYLLREKDDIIKVFQEMEIIYCFQEKTIFQETTTPFLCRTETKMLRGDENIILFYSKNYKIIYEFSFVKFYIPKELFLDTAMILIQYKNCCPFDIEGQNSFIKTKINDKEHFLNNGELITYNKYTNTGVISIENKINFRVNKKGFLVIWGNNTENGCFYWSENNRQKLKEFLIKLNKEISEKNIDDDYISEEFNSFVSKLERSPKSLGYDKNLSYGILSLNNDF